MLSVPVEIQKSAIHGFGVFAKTDIHKGQVIWQFTPGLDQRISLFAVKHSDSRVANYIMERGYINPKQPDQVVVTIDAAQWWNFPRRDEEPNCVLGGVLDGEYLIIAARDIAAGEELTITPESDYDYERKMADHESASS
jgi:SET domain-containing protein